MCGLVGAFRANGHKFHHKIGEFLTQGLYVSALRGMSGTGVGIVNEEYEAHHSKSHIDAGNFVFTDKYDWVTKSAWDARVLMGHTRAPTGTAGVSTKNAHPFHYYDVKDQTRGIMLTHNGHVSNAQSLTPTSFIHAVDSAHVTYAILQDGAMSILPKLDGFYVLIWYDEAKKTMNIARNDHRELYYAMDPMKETLFYASEKSILRFLLDRVGIAYSARENDGGPFQEISPYELWTWDLTKKNLEDPVKTPYAKKSVASTHHGRRTGSNTGNGKGQTSSTWAGNNPGPNQVIYVHVDSVENFHLYPHNSKEGYNDFGHVTGIRRMDNAEVDITGVRYKDWISKWSLIKEAIPCVISTVTKVFDEGKELVEYKARVEEKLALRDINNSKLAVVALPAPKSGTYTGNAGGSTGVVSETTGNVDGEGSGGLKKSLEEGEEKAQEGGKSPPANGETAAIELVSGPNGRMISLSEWQQIAKEGCIVCRGLIISTDIGKVEWVPWAICPEDNPDDIEYGMLCPVCKRQDSKRHAAGLC